MTRYILAIDQGTTSSRAFVVNEKLQVIGQGQKEFQQIYPKPGWVEHNLDEIWSSTCAVIAEALASSKVDPKKIAAIGITNQRETTGIWDRKTGQPIHNAIVWQCRRTADTCQVLKDNGHEPTVHKLTGLVLDPYFSGTKIAWLLDNVSAARRLAQDGELAFGTIDTFLIWKLTGGSVHATDVSNASRTMLMDLSTCEWSSHLCDLLRVPESVLPKIVASSGVMGETKGLSVLPDGIPIAGIAGDQQAALFGQACFHAGEAKCTYGTGSFLLMNTGETLVPSQKGLLTTVAWKIGDTVTYALEGASFIAGAAVQWLRDGLGLIQKAEDVELLAATVPDANGVTFVPALSGLGAPHWDPHARGIITGLTRGATKAHIARATLEGIAWQQYDLLAAMQNESGIRLKELRVDGGAARNNLLMQIQANFLQVPLVRPKITETTVLGAAMLAGLGVGVWKSTQELVKTWTADKRFTPEVSMEKIVPQRQQWEHAVHRCMT
ncbi:MAG: glycerol kinase [Deltaproteobacteria bacterium CG11_big_fil_rev_8_21_14_0_20_47_16]|nr:MAG: glycerol kinase [Deltaproteobacteria bacterium CG11_big_fil_rev_8_21_14_0_20_47_16]